jgi:hypothetical protein
MTPDRYGRQNVQPIGKLTHTLSSNDSPHPDGPVKNVVRTKIIHYMRLNTDCPDPIVFMSLEVNTSGHLYDDFVIFLCFHTRVP